MKNTSLALVLLTLGVLSGCTKEKVTTREVTMTVPDVHPRKTIHDAATWVASQCVED